MKVERVRNYAWWTDEPSPGLATGLIFMPAIIAAMTLPTRSGETATT